MSQIVSRQPQFAGKDDRADAWIISCDVWDASNRPGLILPLNPESLELKFPVRGQESNMYGDKFITRRADPRTGSVFDFPVVSFRFNSGNIQPMHGDDDVNRAQNANATATTPGALETNRTHPLSVTPLPISAQRSRNLYGRYAHARSYKTGPNTTPGMYSGMPYIPVGVQNLYALLSLVNETWITNTNSADVGLSSKRYTGLNRIRVSCSNLVFPGLVLYGFLEDSISWSESADQFNNFETTINLVVTHSLPRLRGVDFANLVSAYKSLFTNRNTFDSEYDISYHRYPAPDVSMDPIPEAPPTPGAPVQLTWAQRIDKFSQDAFGNGVTGGSARAAIGNGVGLAASAADRYADAAMKKLDPAYYAQVQAQREAAQRDTAIANGTGINTVDSNDFSFLGNAA